MPFMNFMAAGRKPNMRRFGLVKPNEDLSHIISSNDIVPVDLTSQVNGVAVTFTLPFAAAAVESLLWNNTPVYGQSDVPGFSLSSAMTSITTNFTAQSGDTLIALVWPN